MIQIESYEFEEITFHFEQRIKIFNEIISKMCNRKFMHRLMNGSNSILKKLKLKK